MLPVVLGAVLIRVLPLPHDATIDPFGSRSLVAVSDGGTVAATLTTHGFASHAVLWNASGTHRMLSARSTIAGFDAAGALLVNADRPERMTASGHLESLDLNSCEKFPQLSMGPLVGGVLSNGSLIATMQSPPVVNLDDTSGQTAPVVLHLRSYQCLNMGNGVALGTRGLYAVGYTAYVAGVPAPSNVVSSKERFVAMRWHERTREPLGTGVAIGVAADGTSVGADTLPGADVAYAGHIHALLWQNGQSAVELAPESPLSVAYAIDARHRIIGMLEDERGRHYAFLWQNGSLRRLDDIVDRAGWRFECGYAFAPDGSIVGIGTYRGTPKVFEVSGL